MTKELGITASFPETSLNPISEKEPHPSKVSYNNIPNTSDKDFFVVYRNFSIINAVLFA